MNMILRRDQMDAFEARAERDFVPRAMLRLRKEYPDLTDQLTDKLLQAMVVKGIARARGHLLSWESSLIRFLELMFTIGPNFDEQPQIQKRLHDSGLSEEQRVNRLLDSTSFTEWRQAAQNYDPTAWGIDVNEHPVLLELRGIFPQ